VDTGARWVVGVKEGFDGAAADEFMGPPMPHFSFCKTYMSMEPGGAKGLGIKKARNCGNSRLVFALERESGLLHFSPRLPLPGLRHDKVTGVTPPPAEAALFAGGESDPRHASLRTACR
jgi:hypothetical protein